MADSKFIAEMKKLSFKSDVKCAAAAKELTVGQLDQILKAWGVESVNRNRDNLVAAQIFRAVTFKGLKGKEALDLALERVEKMAQTMPALVAAPTEMEVDANNPASVDGTVTVSVAKTTKAPKAAKVAKPKAEKKPRVKYDDFTIVERKDRGGWEGWYAGRAEAFRTTVDKVNAFFAKKYGQTGNVLA